MVELVILLSILGIVLFFGLLLVYVTSGSGAVCPFCRSIVHSRATKCSKCQSALTPKQPAAVSHSDPPSPAAAKGPDPLPPTAWVPSTVGKTVTSAS